MGFKAKKKLYRLTFADDTDMAGLEITMASVSMATLLRMQDLSDRGPELANDMTAFHESVSIFTGAMLSWNLEDDEDRPVPVTVEAVLDQDPEFILAIIAAWTKAISGVPDPLDAGSTSGAPSPAALPPMEPVSPSLPS
jgi:hypothetical protein